MVGVIALIILGLFLFIYVAAGVRIVRPYQRGVKERLGKYRATLDPGLALIVPFVDKLRLVDMRESVVDVPPQEVITSDNVVVSVDAVVFYEPTDPQRLIYNINNFLLAITKLAQTNLRNVVGDMQLDSALTSREKINIDLREILDDATDKWGVKVVRVEIQRIDPPPDVMSSMHEQMKAERTRRALVIEASGRREAAITKAEGEKSAAILSAEGDKQQQVLRALGEAEATRARAEAEKFRQLTVAEGEAEAIESVYRAIHAGDPSPDLIAVKYLEALGRIANGRATKIFVPADMSSMLGSIGSIAELFNGGDDAESRADRARRATQLAAGEGDGEPPGDVGESGDSGAAPPVPPAAPLPPA